jgi:hypothetical protein
MAERIPTSEIDLVEHQIGVVTGVLQFNSLR